MKNYLRFTFILLITGLLFSGCKENGRDDYYFIGTQRNQEELKNLFELLTDENNSQETVFAITREISNNFAREKEYARLIHFLGERIVNYPDNIYNSYYLLMTAYAYMQLDSLPIAVLYFDIIVKNYPDLIINDESIHLACLNQLINLTNNNDQRVWYYQELISRFSDNIDVGKALFMLGQTYERVGEWNKSIQAYSNYLLYTGTIISGYPNADIYARQQVDFFNSPKDWTHESLNYLLGEVREALDTGNAWLLEQFRAKVNFFTRSWGQTEVDSISMEDFVLSDYMRGNRIRYADRFDDSSNSTEAFLRTWDWNQYISTWYLYFRKINFPSDPEIHGNWEWAGIYYGERF